MYTFYFFFFTLLFNLPSPQVRRLIDTIFTEYYVDYKEREIEQ